MFADMNDDPLDGTGRSRNRSSKTDHPPLAEAASDDGVRRPEAVTPRELEILRLIWEGHTNRGIAARLNISMKTADTHRANMMKKLRVSNTAQLLRVALERNLLKANAPKVRTNGST